ncbi:unnamed protein product [Caenorhabditis auriculariae]|uniref:Uncharacterized protein n=1 Tax=Caenorhabditis auriculariae TaxID=2777116 RepID=A0A8S1GNV3_9PELO|nr:unnamed protein product [Caenorhabditis auriculariae]
MYSTLEKYRKTLIPGEVQADLDKFKRASQILSFKELTRITAHESATFALSMALLADFDENEPSWTTSDQLLRYEKSIRCFSDRLPLSTIIQIPAGNLLAAANQEDSSITAIDRLADYGCDKSRFVGDAEYRKETIVGLAMTEVEQQFQDALELAEKYHLDAWDLHMASLENALTSLTIAEAKQILKSRGHLAKLRTRPEDFQKTLRSSVLPLLSSNEQFIAYLSLFSENEPEKKASPVLKKVLEKKKDVKAVKMFTDVKYLTNLIVSIPDKILWSLIDVFLIIPIGVEACELAARQLLDGTDVRPPGHPLTLFLLLRRDVEEFLELVAIKSRDEEIAYLERAAMYVEATPNVPQELKDCVKKRLEAMTSSREATASPDSESFTFGSSSDVGNAIMNRRRR